MGLKVIGADISLNHGALVEITDGELSNFWYWTDVASSASRSKRGYRMVVLNTKDRGLKSIHRLANIERYLYGILEGAEPDYIGIEDYAIREEQGAHYLGEVGGISRMLCWKLNIPLRLHDPTSVKMFVAHDGTCQKDSVERAVLDRWGVDFSRFNQPIAKPNKKVKQPKQSRRTSEDLCDAFGIAHMVWTEVQLRRGEIAMSSLHEKEIRVFNRVTKTYPVNLLDREWIKRCD